MSKNINETVMLRPHHILCAVLFIKYGQTRESAQALKTAVDLIQAGTPIEIVGGSASAQQDVVCKTLCPTTTENYHCTHPNFLRRDEAALTQLSDFFGEDLVIGSVIHLNPEKIGQLRDAFAKNSIRDGCAGCDWHSLCTETAAAGYGETRFAKLQAA